MTRTLVRIIALLVAMGAGPSSVLAQTDSLRGVFRTMVTQVAEAGGIPRLDSTFLAPNVAREVRIFTGMGLGGNRVVRLWLDDIGVSGQTGVFWAPQSYHDEKPMRDFVRKEYGCVDIRHTDSMTICWIPIAPRAASWTHLLTRLDHLGVHTIPPPRNPYMGFDGWGVLVESRIRAGYRTYLYWEPDSASTDAGSRATAAVAAAIYDVLLPRRP